MDMTNSNRFEYTVYVYSYYNTDHRLVYQIVGLKILG